MRPIQPDNRYLLTELGIGHFNATMILQYMPIAPATTDPKSAPVMLLVQGIQMRLQQLGAAVRQTGYLDQATAMVLDRLIGPGWEQRPWGQVVTAVLAALKARPSSVPPATIGTEPTVSLAGFDLPAVPGGLMTYAAAGAAAYYFFTKRRR